MSDFASGKHAKGLCDICGFPFPLNSLKANTVRGVKTGTLACEECWDPENPQIDLGRYYFPDPQALRNPRSNAGELAASRNILVPVDAVVSAGVVGGTT